LDRREFIRINSPHPAPSEGYWQHVSRTAMACRFEVTLPLSDRAGVDLARQALDQVDCLEQQLTIFRESSEVSFINRNAAAHAVKIGKPLFELLLLCQNLYRKTGGAFDITSGPLSRCWGFVQREGRIPEPAEIERAKALVGSEKLQLDHDSSSIRFERPGVEINLGSIGKGYALDRMTELFDKRIPSALLSAGSSSMYAIGRADNGNGAWSIGIRHPLKKNRRLAVLGVRDSAISTSGSEEQYFEVNGRRYGHIIDPRSGVPALGVASATVIGTSAAVTDALATAFFVGGCSLAESYCATHPEVSAIMMESGSDHPVIFGRNDKFEVEIINE
jgi:FAD:protein FMN transferase